MVQFVIKYLCAHCSVFRNTPGLCQVCNGPTQQVDI